MRNPRCGTRPPSSPLVGWRGDGPAETSASGSLAGSVTAWKPGSPSPRPSPLSTGEREKIPKEKADMPPTPLLRGIIPPLVTPLSGADSLDLPGLERVVEHVITGGVNGLFL